MSEFLAVKGIVVQGHGVASGRSKTSPYVGGSLKQQLPYFRERGIPFEDYFLGTLNLDISPKKLELIGHDFHAPQVAWTKLIPPEDFFFSYCKIDHQNQLIDGMIYYPSPKTKVENFHQANIVEILAPKIQSLNIGDSIRTLLNSNHCSLT